MGLEDQSAVQDDGHLQRIDVNIEARLTLSIQLSEAPCWYADDHLGHAWREG